MSRVAKKPIALPKGVDCQITADAVSLKGPKGTLSVARPGDVDVKIEDGSILLAAQGTSTAMAGTPSIL